MRQSNTKLSAATILNRYSAYTLAHLRCEPQAEGVLPLAQEGHDRLERAQMDWTAAQRETMAAMAQRDCKKLRLDMELRAARVAVLACVANDRKSKLYRAAFPDGVSPIIRCSATETLGHVRSMSVKLAGCGQPRVEQAMAAVEAAAGELTSAVTAYEEALDAERDAAARVEHAKEEFCKLTDEVYCRLVIALGERRLAEAFFRRIPRAARAGAVGIEAEEPVDGGLSGGSEQSGGTEEPAGAEDPAGAEESAGAKSRLALRMVASEPSIAAAWDGSPAVALVAGDRSRAG